MKAPIFLENLIWDSLDFYLPQFFKKIKAPVFYLGTLKFFRNIYKKIKEVPIFLRLGPHKLLTGIKLPLVRSLPFRV